MEQIKAYEEMQGSAKFEKWYRAMIKEMHGAELSIFDYGFIQYAMTPDKSQIVIMEVYVDPDFRNVEMSNDHPYVKMGEHVIEVGKANGCKYLAGKVEHTNPKKNRIMSWYMWYGMKLTNNDGQAIWVAKEI